MLRIVCGQIVFKTGKLSSIMSNKFIRQFGENVRKARDDMGISQEELAHRANLHRTQISLIERGKRSPRLDTIEQLAKALEIQPAKLIPGL